MRDTNKLVHMRIGRGRGLKLLQIGGFDITLDWSMLIIFALITFQLALAAFPAWHPQWSEGLSWTVAVVSAVLFFASILLHELSHVAVARHYKISVEGITLFMFGGMARIKGEPPHPRAELLMAAAGPAMSITLGLLASAQAASLTDGAFTDALAEGMDPMAALMMLGPTATVLYWIGSVNLVLGIFNLVPGFPLDGGRVLRAVVWALTGDLRRATRWASLGGQGVAWILIGSGFLMLFGVHVPVFGAGLQGLWLMLIGWFLNNAAKMSYQQVVFREALRGVAVSELMSLRFDTLNRHMTVDEFVRRVMSGSQRSYPVLDGDRLEGICSVDDVRKLHYDAWPQTQVGQIMTPRDDLVALAPKDDAEAALTLLAETRVHQLPVLSGERLVGLLRREDALSWIARTQAPVTQARLAGW